MKFLDLARDCKPISRSSNVDFEANVIESFPSQLWAVVDLILIASQIKSSHSDRWSCRDLRFFGGSACSMCDSTHFMIEQLLIPSFSPPSALCRRSWSRAPRGTSRAWGWQRLNTGTRSASSCMWPRDSGSPTRHLMSNLPDWVPSKDE